MVSIDDYFVHSLSGVIYIIIMLAQIVAQALIVFNLKSGNTNMYTYVVFGIVLGCFALTLLLYISKCCTWEVHWCPCTAWMKLDVVFMFIAFLSNVAGCILFAVFGVPPLGSKVTAYIIVALLGVIALGYLVLLILAIRRVWRNRQSFMLTGRDFQRGKYHMNSNSGGINNHNHNHNHNIVGSINKKEDGEIEEDEFVGGHTNTRFTDLSYTIDDTELERALEIMKDDAQILRATY